ncbi:hypothetical protein MMC22_001464 [Lobaria immixta]|nr:hypothetical protein [Lobaria immixta]
MPARHEEDRSRYVPGGYHPVYLSEMFNKRYQVVRKLGYGLYSTVWLAKDHLAERHVALKILTADSYDEERSLYELEILKHVRDADPSHPGYKYVAHLLDDFTHVGVNGEHKCMVFDVMGERADELSRRFDRRKVSVGLVKQIGRQALLGLDYLHASCGIIHTDLKPGNVLLGLEKIEEMVQKHLKLYPCDDSLNSRAPHFESKAIANAKLDPSASIHIRILDFGVASWVHKHLTEWIQPKSLRAPEVFLGAPWGTKVDVWGAACLIHELMQGRVLFSGKADPNGAWTEQGDQLAQMIELFGQLPSDLLSQGKYARKYFTNEGRLLHIGNQLHMSSLEEVIKFKKNPFLTDAEIPQYVSFLRSMLQYRPQDRTSAAEAAQDPWLCS